MEIKHFFSLILLKKKKKHIIVKSCTRGLLPHTAELGYPLLPRSLSGQEIFFFVFVNESVLIGLAFTFKVVGVHLKILHMLECKQEYKAI